MKKIITIAALLLPVSTFATPAETAETATVAVNLEQIQELNTIEDYHMYQKGRNGDSGFRAMNYRPFSYNNSALVNQLYKPNIVDEIKKPGVVFGEDCGYWKTCLQKTYHATNQYNYSYKKYQPTETAFQKAWTRGNLRGAKNMLDGERSGLYKLERWGR